MTVLFCVHSRECVARACVCVCRCVCVRARARACMCFLFVCVCVLYNAWICYVAPEMLPVYVVILLYVLSGWRVVTNFVQKNVLTF